MNFLSKEIASACSSDKYICLLGDLNAQTGELTDFTTVDNFYHIIFILTSKQMNFFIKKLCLKSIRSDCKEYLWTKRKITAVFV